MDAIIDDVLTLAREGRVVEGPELISVGTVARRAWATVDTRDCSLSVTTDARVVADPGRLQSLFENLFQNSADHAGPGVTVTVGLATPVGTATRATEDRDPVGFYVADDGRGIPSSEHEQVFEATYSTAESGTGFGLNIVATIADAHGWTPLVSESETGGVRFTFTGVDIAPAE